MRKTPSEVEDAVTAISEKPDLPNVKLTDEYSYPSLPLCVIDAVFSIGVRCGAVRRVVAAWSAVHQPNIISDALLATGCLTGEELARAYFGGKQAADIHAQRHPEGRRGHPLYAGAAAGGD